MEITAGGKISLPLSLRTGIFTVAMTEYEFYVPENNFKISTKRNLFKKIATLHFNINISELI